jgi:hypothetical protein
MTQAFNLSQLANNLNTTGQLDATDGLVNAVPVANGGTGASTASAARTNLDVPATGGSGATGTWPINISGNAASATTAGTATTATTAGNGGVTSIVAGTNITISGGTGAVTVNSPAYPLLAKTSVASTSGLNIDFTTIPNTTKRITVIFSNTSLSGSSSVNVQIGSGGFTATGYESYGVVAAGGAGNFGYLSTTGFVVPSGNPTIGLFGTCVICNIEANNWVASVACSGFNGTNALSIVAGGSVSLAGVLDRLRITTLNGTDTFDNGAVNVFYE